MIKGIGLLSVLCDLCGLRFCLTKLNGQTLYIRKTTSSV